MIQQDYSLAIYGSQARNDSDFFSDKDFLIAHDSTFNPNSLEKKYSTLGWNCSTYTYERLEYMARHGYLFLQHIKQDAKIIQDNGKLARIIKDYSPMNHYSSEIDDAQNYFKMLHYIENTAVGLYWALDVISVGLRNLCILKLANAGEFEFSQAKIYKKIQKLLSLTAYELELVDMLRQYKYAYRNKQCSTFPIDYFVELCKVLTNKFNLHISYNFINTREFLGKQIEFIQLENSLKSYQYQRLCESILNSPMCVLTPDKYTLWHNIIRNSRDPYDKFNEEWFVSNLFRQFLDDILT